MGDSKQVAKPHIVCMPLPVQSHIKAMLKFSKLLHHKGFHITFVNTEFNHKRFLKSLGPNSLDGSSDFRFETIPDGLRNSEDDTTQDLNLLGDSIRNKLLAPFVNLITNLNNNSSNPPVTRVVSDGFMSFTLTAGEELGIPTVLFFSFAASSVMGYKQFPILAQKGIAPFKEESWLTNGVLDKLIDWLPGIKTMRLRDLPNEFMTANPDDPHWNFVLETIEKFDKASAIILHTFDALESIFMEALSSPVPVYAIGPLQLLINQLPPEESLKPMGYSLWKEDNECLQWLNSKAPRSVLYVNFGSIVNLTPEHLVELGWGLANSKFPFLWVIRPDLVVGESAILPPEFVSATKKRGLTASWCPQEEVLNHPSVGGFLTHSGWNSTIESVTAGVPMLCRPFFSDQQTNCYCTCNEWGVGMEMIGDVRREEVEKLVKELMKEEKGEKMRDKAMEWKKLAEEATAPHGSSSSNLDKLVNQILL